MFSPLSGNIKNINATENKNNSTFAVELKARQFIPHPGINFTSITKQKGAERGIVHFLLQLYKLPTYNETKKLQQQGITLLNYLTGNTYIASANIANLSKLSNIGGIRWADSLQPTDKISENLKAGRIGKWAQADDGRVVLTIQFHNDTKISEDKDIIKKLGVNVTAAALQFLQLLRNFLQIR